MKEYLDSYDVFNIREFISVYGTGLNYGDFYIRNAIKENIEVRREKYLDLISMFFKIFKED